MNDITKPIRYLELRTVQATFTNSDRRESKAYSYYVPDGDDPQINDLVLTSFNWGKLIQAPTGRPWDLATMDPNHRAGYKSSSMAMEAAIEQKNIARMMLQSATDDEFDANSINTRATVMDAKLARITYIDINPCPKATRFYLKLLPLVDLRKAHESNLHMVEQVRERKKVYEQLDLLLAKQSRLDQYEKLAANNPEAKALLDLLK